MSDQPMPDQSVSEPPDERLRLPVAEGVLLWCMRVWVLGLRREIDAEARIGAMLARLDAPDAAPYLDGFMFALSRGATRRIAIHCACHDRVEGDERLLLHALCLVQMGQLSWALHLLRGMATDAAARAALSSAQGLGTELALAGCYLHEDGPAGALSEADGYPAPAAVPCPATLH